MKPGRCPQQGGQFSRSGGGGPPQPGSFGKLIRERLDQPVVVSSGIGKPDPEVQRATTFVAHYPALPFRQPPEEVVVNPNRTSPVHGTSHPMHGVFRAPQNVFWQASDGRCCPHRALRSLRRVLWLMLHATRHLGSASRFTDRAAGWCDLMAAAQALHPVKLADMQMVAPASVQLARGGTLQQQGAAVIASPP